jgi:tetratricopeptide (TPR) repeat protein
MFFTEIRFRINLVKAQAVFVLLICFRLCMAVNVVPDDMNAFAMSSIEYVYNEKFRQAEDEAKNIIKKYPQHPAGYFFLAVAIDAWMEYYQSNSREDEFYRCCDKAIECGERILDREPDNFWVKFFSAGADGYKGTYETRYEKWITAFRHGWKGVSSLMEIQKKAPEIHDVNFGIGTYDYWRSAMTKMLWWMPGVSNKSKEGIAQLYDSRKFGIYTRIASSKNLITILINEKRFNEALDICNEMLEKYPATLMFYWGKAEAFYWLEKYDQSEQLYHYILSRVEAESIDNHYNAVLCHLWLARIYLKKKMYTQAIAECNRMKNYKIDAGIMARLDKYFSEANSIKKESEAATLSRQEEYKP